MDVLIIGGNRFVGKQLAEQLIEDGHGVTCFNRSGTGPEGCTIIQGNRNGGVHIANALYGKEYTHIIDMCLFKSKQFEVMKPFIPKDVPYIFISSGAVYDPQVIGGSALLETDNVGHSPFGSYGNEKLACEEMVKNHMDHWTILRPPYIIGPGCHRPRIGFYLDLMRRVHKVGMPRHGSRILSFVSAKDMVKTIIWAMKSPNSKQNVFNVSNNDPMCLASFVNQIGHDDPHFNMLALYTFEGYNEDEPFFPGHLNLNGRNLQETSWLKFQPTDEIIKETIEWYDNEGKYKYGHETLPSETVHS